MSEPQPSLINKRKKRLLRWLIEGLVLILAFYLIHLWQTRNAVEGLAPSLSGRLLNGDRFSLEQRPNKPLLVYFWASWCPVCGITSDNVDRLAEGYEVISVSMQSGDAREVARQMEEKALKFPVLVDPRGDIARTWGVRGVPTLYVLDGKNRIRFVSVGYTTTPGMIARMRLAE